MPHSFEEIRAVALDILAGRERVAHEPSQYEHLKLGVGEVFARREGRIQPGHFGATYPLDHADQDFFLELFWDLFRQGIISLGLNDANREFPFFRVTSVGRSIAESQSAYFFHDVSAYERTIRENVPQISDVTLIYLKEAMQAFRSGCILSATVMLGVASEHTFLLLLETIEANPAHQPTYAAAIQERMLLRKFNSFRAILDRNLATLPADLREDLDTQFAGILSVIRTFRNESGHPTGRIVDREQAFVLLQLFIPYCRRLYRLMEHFRQ